MYRLYIPLSEERNIKHFFVPDVIRRNLSCIRIKGTQFTSLEFILHCQELGITQSMSHAGCPYEDSPMERYYNTLKEELIYQYCFETVEDLDYAVSEFAYYWYNQVRPHSFNEYLTPYEKRYELA